MPARSTKKPNPARRYDLGGGAVLTVLAPSEPFFTEDQMKAGGNEPNANSIVLRLDYGDFSMLFMGDAEEQTEQRLLRKDARPQSPIDQDRASWIEVRQLAGFSGAGAA